MTDEKRLRDEVDYKNLCTKELWDIIEECLYEIRHLQDELEKYQRREDVHCKQIDDLTHKEKVRGGLMAKIMQFLCKILGHKFCGSGSYLYYGIYQRGWRCKRCGKWFKEN